MGKELWLFTIRFPFGNGESFLENELPILARGFERIRLFPLMPEGPARALPPNVRIEQLFTMDAFKGLSPLALLSDLSRFQDVLRVSKRSAPSAAIYKKHRRTLISRLRQALYREHMLRRRIGASYDPARVVLYSYWTSDWATVLGLWKLKDPRVRFVSRMMGFDMFDHRAPDGWQMLQAFHIRQVERVFVIARAGLDHMRERFPQHADKFSISYLATVDHGIGSWSPSDTLRIASCANLVPLKRVHLLAEALRKVGDKVHWTHFGDGAERGRIETILHGLPTNVQVELKGNRPNAEIIDWYKRTPVDVFVHTSETEGGAPVALQEAASFGIPLIGADAGGVSEIVTERTGKLLPHALTPELLANELSAFRTSRWYTTGARQQVRAYWSEHFNAEQVHGRLLHQLLG